jgi:hypothetical protein
MKDKKLAQYSPLPIRIISRIAFAIVGLPKLSNIVWTEHFFAIIGLPAVRLCPRIARRNRAKEGRSNGRRDYEGFKMLLI